MTKVSSIVFASLAFASQAFAAQPLLTPQELQAKLSDPQVRVIDIRDAKTYAANHIAGAVNAPYGQWRGPAENPGELPALPKLTTLVQSLGLTPATHAVVVSSGADATDFGAAARVYWTLKVLGLKELSILNGGDQAWTKAGLPQSKEATKIAASNFQPAIDGTQIATKEEVQQRVKSGDSVLLDARPASLLQWRGPRTRRQGRRHPARRRELHPRQVVRQWQLDLRVDRTGEADCRLQPDQPGQGDRVLLQHRPLGGDQLVCGVRSARPEERQAVRRLHDRMVAGPQRPADGQCPWAFLATHDRRQDVGRQEVQVSSRR